CDAAGRPAVPRVSVVCGGGACTGGFACAVAAVALPAFATGVTASACEPPTSSCTRGATDAADPGSAVEPGAVCAGGNGISARGGAAARGCAGAGGDASERSGASAGGSSAIGA